ncbi:MAG: zinc-binding alcohol dehydrogenase family protein [Alphaproteobacteria bacterium]
MRAIGYKVPGPIDRADALQDFDAPRPSLRPRDVLVEVRAISVNPVDAKLRGSAKPADDGWKILGFDASGIVVETGAEVNRFKRGDEVYYAGDMTRTGSNSEFHAVDERIVGRKPASLDWGQAAALPLTAITAWESLFDRMDVKRPVPGASSILIIGGAGGVGSIATQLARQLTDLSVVATASRPETQAWARDLGAHHVIDHTKPLSEQITAAGLPAPGFVLCTTNGDKHAGEIAKLIAPQGRLGLIDNFGNFDAGAIRTKSISVHWELMFTRAMYQTADMAEQAALLDEVSRMVDAGKIKTTLGERFGAINATNLKRAHAFIESGRARGKIVLEGFA